MVIVNSSFICWEFIIVHIHYINRGIRDSLLMQSLVSILHVVYHLCSLGSLNKDRLVDLCCWLTCQESEQGVFISLQRTTLYDYVHHESLPGIAASKFHRKLCGTKGIYT